MLYHCVQVAAMQNLRTASAEGDWDTVQDLLSQLADSGLHVPESCRPEVDAIMNTSINCTAIGALKDGISHGRPLANMVRTWTCSQAIHVSVLV